MSLFRGLGARKDSVRGTAPIEVRKALSGLFSATGVLPGGPSPLLIGTSGWTYTVVGPAYFVTSRGAADGHQLYGNDGTVVIGTTGVGSTVPIAPGAGLSRIDIAWTSHPTIGENADTSSEPLFGVESGVAAASNPVAPTLPAGAIELGRNTMTSAATSTSSAGNTVTQSARPAALRGTPILVATQAARDALTKYDGLMVWRLDQNWLETCDGTTWSTPNSQFSILGASIDGPNYDPSKSVRRHIARSTGVTSALGVVSVPMPAGMVSLLDVHATLIFPGSPSALLLMRTDVAPVLPGFLSYQLRSPTTDVGLVSVAYDMRLEVVYQT